MLLIGGIQWRDTLSAHTHSSEKVNLTSSNVLPQALLLLRVLAGPREWQRKNEMPWNKSEVQEGVDGG